MAMWVITRWYVNLPKGNLHWSISQGANPTEESHHGHRLGACIVGPGVHMGQHLKLHGNFHGGHWSYEKYQKMMVIWVIFMVKNMLKAILEDLSMVRMVR